MSEEKQATKRRLRWRRQPQQTGLAAVGAGLYRASDYTDGQTIFATVSPLGGNWRRKFAGWYFSMNVNGVWINTCSEPSMDEIAVKKAAEADVKAALSREQP